MMFHLTHHRPTTVQVEAMAEPAEYVIFKDLAPTMEMPAVAPVQIPVPYPAPVDRAAAMWAHVRSLAAANDAANVASEQREESWHRRVLARLTALGQRVSATAALHERWGAHWQSRQSQIIAAQSGRQMDAAYEQGGTAMTAGLVDQVRAMIVANALGSGVAA